MKIYIMTDMEGVAGAINSNDWMKPGGRYYEEGKKFLTEEVNAAIRGFFDGGADEITVSDGHGSGGITPELLDSRAWLLRGWPTGWPFCLDESYDAIAFVGQHAKTNTPFAHLAHTQSFGMASFTINGVSVGEFGQFACCAAFLKIPVIFGSGDRAFTEEAHALAPGIKTVEVKRGVTPGTGEELSAEDYALRNTSAIHMHPKKSRELIEDGVRKAAERFLIDPSTFPLIKLNAPFRIEAFYRSRDGAKAYGAFAEHPTSLIECMNKEETKL